MSPAVAWAITAGCATIVTACVMHLSMHRRAGLWRVSVVMGVTLAADILIAELVPWAVMWVPLFVVHMVAAHTVMMRPAGRTHVVIGSLYAVLAVVDVAFALHGDKAHVWSMYMDIINVLTIAQAGALLIGVLSDGHKHTRQRRVARRLGGADFQGSGDLGVSR